MKFAIHIEHTTTKHGKIEVEAPNKGEAIIKMNTALRANPNHSNLRGTKTDMKILRIKTLKSKKYEYGDEDEHSPYHKSKERR